MPRRPRDADGSFSALRFFVWICIFVSMAGMSKLVFGVIAHVIRCVWEFVLWR